MELPITSFDGFQLGTFDETDKQQSDTYSTNRIPRWYGGISEYINDRTNFVVSRDIDFGTLRQWIYHRMDSLITGDEYAKRPATLSENESRVTLGISEKMNTNADMIGNVTTVVAGKPMLLSSINELSIVTTIDRYAFKAPPEQKLQAATEYAVWVARQPTASNRANALVRSGAASLLDTYKHRGL